MIEDISVYKDVRKNAKCPCGSGKTFKKCCMNEYRDAKKNKPKAILSPYTPLKQLEDEDIKFFLEFYQKLLIFSHQHKNSSDILFIDAINDTIADFMQQERVYFYENVDEIIANYIERENPNTNELELLQNIKEAEFSNFVIMSHRENSAVLMNPEQNFYNIQALDSPFNEIFTDKLQYIGARTALIAYKNCYISDGIYNVFKLDSKLIKELEKVPYSQPHINYIKDKKITVLPLLTHFSLFCAPEHFQEMEEIVLTKIPELFAKALLNLFDEKYSQSKYIVPAFFRSTDLTNEFNNEEGDHQFSMMISGSPVSSFELGNRDEIIPYEVMAKYYQQKPLKDSASKSVYEKIQNLKSSHFGSYFNLSSFYTMIGMLNINIEDIDDFLDFLERFNKPKYRKKLMVGIDNLFEELSQEFGFEMSAIFLGVGIGLDSIYDEIAEYREVMQKYDGEPMEEVKKYSLRKGK